MSSSCDSCRGRPRAAALLALAILLAAVVVALSGCATQDSDIPWNAPQPWEGSPLIPGFQRE